MLVGSSGGAGGCAVHVLLERPPGLEELEPKLRAAGGGDVKSLGGFGSAVAGSQGENQPPIAVGLDRKPSRKIEAEADLFGNRSG